MLDFNSPKSPFLRISESFRWDIGQISTWKVCFFIKICLFIKNLTDFHKMVETGVDPHLLWGQNQIVSAFGVHCFCCLP